MYHMSVYLLPKTTIKRMDKIRRKFFWQGVSNKKKYHLIKWTTICRNKKKGGLGIKDLTKLNISLLCKWWCILEKDEGLWQDIVKFKYLRGKCVSNVKHRQDDSPMWSDLVKVKNFYMQGRIVKTFGGELTRFWYDDWLFDKPLCTIVPSLFTLCEQKDVTCKQVVSGESMISFRRRLNEGLLESWEKIQSQMRDFQFSSEKDVIMWRWEKNGKFSLKSLYNAQCDTEINVSFKHVWKSKVPKKIKNFIWLMTNNAVLTKGNLIKRKWVGNPECFFCSGDESIDHLFFKCVVARVVWG